MRRVALLKLTALGDVVRATPLLSALAGAHPDIEVSWIVESVWAPVLDAHPLLSEIIPFDSGEWRQLRRKSWAQWAARMIGLRRSLIRRRFDAVINFHPEKWWTALLCAAPRRVGLYAGALKTPFRALYTDVVTEPDGINTCDHYLQATTALGCLPADPMPSLGETTEEASFFADFQARHRLPPDRPLVVLAPFSTSLTKDWESERYARICDLLARDFGASVVVTMAPGETERAEAIAAQAHSPPVLAQGTTLRQYIALIRRADLVVCVDSSALHLASALRTPYVTLFGSTAPGRTVVPNSDGTVLYKAIACAPCFQNTCGNPMFRDCLKQIGVDEVGRAIVERLGTRAPYALPVMQNGGY